MQDRLDEASVERMCRAVSHLLCDIICRAHMENGNTSRTSITMKQTSGDEANGPQNFF
jgi:hypothetical protein